MFECCRNCKPPKRYPGCQDHCPEGKAAKAAFNKRKEEVKRQRGTPPHTVYEQIVDSVHRAQRRRRGMHK